MERALPLAGAQRYGESAVAPLDCSVDWVALILSTPENPLPHLQAGLRCEMSRRGAENSSLFQAVPNTVKNSLYVSHISDLSVCAGGTPTPSASINVQEDFFLLDRQLFVPGGVHTLRSPGLLSTRTEAPTNR